LKRTEHLDELKFFVMNYLLGSETPISDNQTERYEACMILLQRIERAHDANRLLCRSLDDDGIICCDQIEYIILDIIRKYVKQSSSYITDTFSSNVQGEVFLNTTRGRHHDGDARCYIDGLSEVLDTCGWIMTIREPKAGGRFSYSWPDTIIQNDGKKFLARIEQVNNTEFGGNGIA